MAVVVGYTFQTHGWGHAHVRAHALNLKKALLESVKGLLVVGYNLLRVVRFLYCQIINIHERGKDLAYTLKLS